MLTIRILLRAGTIDPAEVNHMIVGKMLPNLPPVPESLKSYITDILWNNCKSLDYIAEFNGLCESLEQDQLQWKKWYGEEKAEEADLPKHFKDISKFHKLMLIRAMRSDRVTNALKQFVIDYMGERYIEEPPFNIFEMFPETSYTTPIFFVLFPGVDPTKDVEAMGATMDISIVNGKFVNISMGQGQEERALKELRKAAEKGTWVMFQNVHLMQTWLKAFERTLEEVTYGA